ncbi:MAG: prephenate dehydrogenase/arogenate dehydrogenase family protein [Armatimonadota bacterium]|nr:prephenate dehydrogenase/arogenate dehydrogenase family protein [bacterium]
MSTSGEDNFIFDTIAIVGVGLIGGSLGMAAKRRHIVRRVVGIGRTEQKLMQAKLLGAIDEYSLDLETGASEADLVFVCPPVRNIIPTIEQMASGLKPGAIITDVGSTKSEIVGLAPVAIPESCSFIGGHPMTGSEQGGVEAAFPDLFVGARYVLTPDSETDLMALGKMTEFAEAIGSEVLLMSPEEHDKAAAIISHLPHAMSGALLEVAEIAQRESGKVFPMAAGSFRDLTRITDSTPEIWRDICLTNAGPLCEAIDALRDHLEIFKNIVAAHDEEGILRFFERAKAIRSTYLRITK